MQALFGTSNPSEDVIQWKYDDIPTPLSKKDYIDVAVTALEDFKNKNNDNDGWSVVVEAIGPDDVLIEKKTIDGSDISIVRSTGYIKLNEGETIKDLMFQLFDSIDDKRSESCKKLCGRPRKSLHDNIIEFSKLATITDNIYISRTIGACTGLTSREFIALRTYEPCSNGGYLMAVQSINIKKYIFDQNYIRGICSSGVELTSITDDIVQLVSIEHIEPKGWVPAAIINWFTSTAGDWIKAL